jgi:hypothetical protein
MRWDVLNAIQFILTFINHIHHIHHIKKAVSITETACIRLTNFF